MSASFAAAMEMWAFRVQVYDDLEVRTAAATTGWVAILDAAKADVQSDYGAAMLGGYEADRDAAAAILARSNVEAGMAPFFADIAQQTGSTSGTASGQFRDLFDYMHTNSLLINSRAFTMQQTPTPDAGNVGDGDLTRCLVDDRGYDLEGWFADSFTAEALDDANQTGLQYEESFLVKGTTVSVDSLKRAGTGLEETVSAWSEKSTEDFVQNPGFESYGGTSPTAGNPQTPTSLAGWTPASGGFTNLQVQVDQLWRTPPGSSSSISVTLTDNETLSQDLRAVKGTTFDTESPYREGIAVYRRSGCDGQFIISLGTVSRNVDVTALSNNAWTWIWWRATPDKFSWYENFKANDLTLSYQLTSRTTGQLVLDGGLFGPMVQIGGAGSSGRGSMGTYVFLRAGRTPYLGGAGGLTGDRFSWSDSESATRGKNQYWLSEGDVGYLPATSAGYEDILDK